MKRVEELIPKAIEVIKNELIFKDIEKCSDNEEYKNKIGKLSNEYNGYVSNFGASIIQSGVLPTVAFFDNKNKDKNKECEATKFKFAKAIAKMLNTLDYEGDRLIKMAIKDDNYKSHKFKKDLNNVLIALKLAMRTFEVYKKENKNDE